MIEEDEYCDRKYCQWQKLYYLLRRELDFTVCERCNRALNFFQVLSLPFGSEQTISLVCVWTYY
jgi:hypothetical protein